MKKSQVLAALALALALGVAAPVASTFATYGGTTAEQAASEEAVNGAVESAKALPDYTGYSEVYDAIATLDGAVETGNASALAKLREELKKIDGIDDVKGSVNIDSNAYTYESLTNIVNGWINDQKQIIQKGEADNATEEQKNAATAAQTMIEALEAAETAAETAGDFATAYDTAVKAIMAAQDDDGKDIIDTSDLVTTNGKYTKADYEKVKARATVSPYPAYAALIALVEKAEAMEGDPKPYAPATVANLVSQIEAAVAQIESGDFDTPVTPDEPADEEKPTTPDTGVNTASEASATASVSILSGLASVATAAGVVIRKAFRK